MDSRKFLVGYIQGYGNQEAVCILYHHYDYINIVASAVTSES